MKFLFLALSLIVATTAELRADVGQDTVSSGGQTEELLAEVGGKETGHSVAPVVGYEPTFGFVFGAAYFYSAPHFSFGMDLNTNLKRVYQGHTTFIHRWNTRWEYGIKAGVTKGYDPFYGQGGETKPEDFSRLWGTTSINRLHVAYKPTPIFSVGAFVDNRIRTEEPGTGPGGPAVGRVAQDETSFGVGLFQKIDTRERKESPKEGFVFGTEFRYMPGSFSSMDNREGFSQLQGDFIVYKEILTGAIPDVIAAFQLQGGMTFGEPTYAYDYRLGGADAMRGYLENRFRGEKYYLQQTELRFPLFQPLSGAAFLGFGDATDNTFTNPKLAYGVGLRIGLPPDFINKIRIDIGFGRDQYGVFADFGQTF